MARKKEMTYGDIMRRADELRRMAQLKRSRMAYTLAGVMDDNAAAALADLSDAELRQVGTLMFSRAVEIAAQVKAETEADRKARQEAKAAGQDAAGKPSRGKA